MLQQSTQVKQGWCKSHVYAQLSNHNVVIQPKAYKTNGFRISYHGWHLHAGFSDHIVRTSRMQSHDSGILAKDSSYV